MSKRMGMDEDERLSAPETAEPDPKIDDTEETREPSPEGAGSDSTRSKPKKRKGRKRRWILGLSITGGVIVLLLVAAFITAHYTSASAFCDTCHEMDAYYSSWQASEHSSAECRDCHIPPGTVSYVETKLGSFREIYVHFFGNPDAPLAVTREIPNSSCFRCHDNPPADPSLPTVTFSHAEHAGRAYCITCHVRVVHKTLSPGYLDPGEMSSCFKCHDGVTAPNNCSYCHTQPHEKRGECSSCHNTSGWTSAGTGHPFARTGAHASLTCTQCHVSKPGVATMLGTDLAQADPACVSCHGDNHNGLTDCAGCHTPTTRSS
jgi:nitrate/TMAO reductase-like tetraheme cytochrome c subunit